MGKRMQGFLAGVAVTFCGYQLAALWTETIRAHRAAKAMHSTARLYAIAARESVGKGR